MLLLRNKAKGRDAAARIAAPMEPGRDTFDRIVRPDVSLGEIISGLPGDADRPAWASAAPVSTH